MKKIDFLEKFIVIALVATAWNSTRSHLAFDLIYSLLVKEFSKVKDWIVIIECVKWISYDSRAETGGPMQLKFNWMNIN